MFTRYRYSLQPAGVACLAGVRASSVRSDRTHTTGGTTTSPRTKSAVRLALLSTAAACFMLTGACGLWPGQGSNGARSTLGSAILNVASASHFEAASTNDALAAAEFVPVTETKTIIEGDISTSDDVDIYDLGPASIGDRIVVDLSASSSLNGVLALLDGDGNSILVNDHRNVYLGRQTPFIDVVLRRDSNTCFLAISSTPGFDSTGAYTLSASKQGRSPITGAQPDDILLVFNGGNNVRIGSRAPIDVPPFDAASIDPAYAGESDALAAATLAAVRRDFAGLNITIYSTSEGDRFDGFMSRVYFGTFDAALLGVAEGVDEFNATRTQNAIVFTDTFQAFVPLNPSTEELAQAIANVTSHEIGHLLGLVHSRDPRGVMDVTASLRSLLADQQFRRSPIYDSVFPLGFQNAPQQLVDTLGGQLLPAAGKRGAVRSRTLDANDMQPPARIQEGIFSTCQLEDYDR